MTGVIATGLPGQFPHGDGSDHRGGAHTAGRALDQTGGMVAVAAEGFRRTWDLPSWWREWLDQCWFLARVTTLPVLLIAVPLGATISLQVGQLARQLGAQSATGSAVVLAIVREVAPVATALLWGRAASRRGRSARRFGSGSHPL